MESPLAVALRVRECLQNGDSANALRGLEEMKAPRSKLRGIEPQNP